MRTPHVVRRAAIAALGAVLATGTLPAHAAPDAPTAPYQMPFPCGESWFASTRSYHSPSPMAVDWNRPDDLGDPVVASAAGIVLVADRVDNSGYGRWVMLDHGDGEATLYAHLSTVTVNVGDVVEQAQQVGTLGTSGNSTGPHLHFEERDGGTVVYPWFAGAKLVFGDNTSANCVSVPLAANMRGSAAAELVLFKRGATPTFEWQRPAGGTAVKRFGTAGDLPALGDWDGNGRANLGIWRPSTGSFHLRSGGTTQTIVFGQQTDQPVAGDWNGDGVDEVGVWQPAAARFRLRLADGTITDVGLGSSQSRPVVGDWDADGSTDLGVYDGATSTFTLRVTDDDDLPWLATVPFGEPGDLPVTGDWDGDGKTDLGVWDPATALLSQRFATAAARRRPTSFTFGTPRGAMGTFDPELADRLVRQVREEDRIATDQGTVHGHDHRVPDGASD